MSCIDNILTNDFDSLSSSETTIVDVSISDHSLIIHILKRASPRSKLTKFSKYQITEANIREFAAALIQIDWENVIMSNDSDLAFNHFYDQFMTEFYTHFPRVNHTRRSAMRDKPWFNDNLRTLVRDKNKAYQKYRHNQCNFNKEAYKSSRNNLNTEIATAKRRYAASLMADAKNTKQEWKILNRHARPHAQKQSIGSIQLDGNLITDPLEMACSFNDYFTSIGPNLASSISTDRYTLEPVDHSFILSPTNPEEISKIIKQMRNAAPGFDQVQASVLKATANTIAVPLACLINMSFQQGKVPLALKKAVVSPIHKAKSRDNVNNYRPVSILPALSKIYERAYHCRLYDYSEQHNILHQLQFGFRPASSTELALLKFTNIIHEAWERRELVLSIMLD